MIYIGKYQIADSYYNEKNYAPCKRKIFRA